MGAFFAGIGERIKRSELWGTVAGVVIAIVFKLEWEQVALIASTLGLYTISRGMEKAHGS